MRGASDESAQSVLVSPFVPEKLSKFATAILLALVVSAAVAEPAAAAMRRSRTRRAAALSSVVLPASASAWDVSVGEAARAGLGGAQGAVVAMDPRTGRVHALINPALGMQRAFQPCSVFKIVVGIAGLSEGIITPGTTYRCTKGCWMWAGHGSIDLGRALAVSCNPYFEWVGEQLGYERVQRYAHLLGLAEPSLTAAAKPALMPSSRVPAGSRQRWVAAKPSGPLTCGRSTTPPFTVAEISTASCSAEVAMPSAWLERCPTASGRTNAGTKPAVSPVRLIPDGSPSPSRCA